jgi:hypothetical protein
VPKVVADVVGDATVTVVKGEALTARPKSMRGARWAAGALDTDALLA